MFCANVPQITCLFIGLLSYGSARPPNFVIMFMDDVGWGDLGCYGNPAKETPNLDQMAAEGMLFTDFYTGSAICSPSRASLMTGRLPVRNGFYSTNQVARNSYAPQSVTGGIADSEVLLPELLQKHGYTNKIVGKWHLGHRDQYLPLRHGFNEWFGAPNCHYEYDNIVAPNIPVYRDSVMTGRYYDDYKINHTTGLGNLTQMYISEALTFIEQRAAKNEPFLLYWAPDATHTPLYASDMFRGKSRRGLYGDTLMEIDYGVGLIMKKLKDLKLDDNTFAFYSSDNGAATYAFTEGGSNGPFLCGKQTTFEGGFRQPALAWWPGRIKPGQTSKHVGTLMDIFPTVLEMASIPPPVNVTLDGLSLTSALFDHFETDKRPVFYYRGDTLFKVRYRQYKAHFLTWDTPKVAQVLGYHYCPGQYIPGVTTPEMTNYTTLPLLFHLGRDPGEKFMIDPNSTEYVSAIDAIRHIVSKHKSTIEFSTPQFNLCDIAAQNWAPNGCEKVGRCMKVPPSVPYQCDWPY